MRQIRPIPYYTRQDDEVMKECARQLRECFKKVMSRRLPMHPMTPWTHSTVIDYVAKHKNDYPYVLRADIEKYYPNVDPFRMIAQVQLAHRDLYALSCVSKSFRETFLPRMQLWARSLPAGQGIPLGSAMSYILASMTLVPLWLGIKRKFNVKLLVFADDILVLCKDDYTARQVWDYIADRLFADLGVKLNSQKTYGGRFAGREIDFCGWSFAGGYTRIRKYKADGFKIRLERFINSRRKENTRAFIKAVNRKIDGFANYYKHGDVFKQFEELDRFVRMQVRQWLCRGKATKAYHNKALEDIGLHSLVNAYRKAHKKKGAKNQPRLKPVESYYAEKKPAAPDFGAINQIAQHMEKLTVQQQQVIALLRQQNKLLEQIFQLDKESYM